MNSRKFYLEALSTLYVLMPTTEYDNARPRSVRLYFRDPGLVTALTGGDPAAVLEDRRREAEFARLVAFDHTMRFAYGVNASQGHGTDIGVGYWEAREGTVDFAFEAGETPVPVALAYRTPADDARAALNGSSPSTTRRSAPRGRQHGVGRRGGPAADRRGRPVAVLAVPAAVLRRARSGPTSAPSPRTGWSGRSPRRPVRQ